MANSQREETSPTGLGVRAGLLVFGIVFVVHTLSPSAQVGDSRLSVAVANQVLRDQSLDLSDVDAVTMLDSTYNVRDHERKLLPYFP